MKPAGAPASESEPQPSLRLQQLHRGEHGEAGMVLVPQTHCAAGKASKQPSCPQPHRTRAGEASASLWETRDNRSRFLAPPFLDTGLPGAKRTRAHSQEALLDANLLRAPLWASQ